MTEDTLFDDKPDPKRFLQPNLQEGEAAARLAKARAAALFPQYRHDVEEPNTSFLAAKSKRPDTARELNAVRQALADNPEGLTDYEISKIVGILRTSAGARRIALRDEYGEVEYAGFTRKTDTKRSAKVWRLKHEKHSTKFRNYSFKTKPSTSSLRQRTTNEPDP